MLLKNEILLAIKDAVKSVEPSASIILYGSFARGENTPNSDIDLLILIDKHKLTREVKKKIKYLLYDIEFEIGQIISPVILSRNDWETRHRITPFYENVITEGVNL